MSTIRHWLWLSTRGAAPGMYAARLLDHFGSPEAAFFASEAEYDQIWDLPKLVREALNNKDMTEVDGILSDCERLHIRILTLQDVEYPERLRQLNDAPCVLYVKGTLPQIDEEAAIGVVGARKASPYGVMVAGRMAMDLARQGALVVSGSARGIDESALKGALKGGGKVVSVLGNGIDVVYPKGNDTLYDDVAASGALISEYPPGTPPLGEHFPVRNRILAGLCLGVVVVEGTEKSGSLITARWALEQDRDVYAVPGNIDAGLSQGPNSLIRRGEARLVQSAWDVLEDYTLLYPSRLRPRMPLPKEVENARLRVIRVHAPAEKVGKKTASRPVEEPSSAGPAETEQASTAQVLDLVSEPEAVTDDEAAVLRALQGEAAYTSDDLVEKTGIPARRVLSALTMLQVRQMVWESDGKRFSTPVLLKE